MFRYLLKALICNTRLEINPLVNCFAKILGYPEAATGGVLYKKGVLKNFANFTGKHLCQSLFFNKVRPGTLLKRGLWHRCFPVNFAKFLRTPFFIEHLLETADIICNDDILRTNIHQPDSPCLMNMQYHLYYQVLRMCLPSKKSMLEFNTKTLASQPTFSCSKQTMEVSMETTMEATNSENCSKLSIKSPERRQ